nr:transcription factor bHLH167-like [Ipomoea batatas]
MAWRAPAVNMVRQSAPPPEEAGNQTGAAHPNIQNEQTATLVLPEHTPCLDSDEHIPMIPDVQPVVPNQENAHTDTELPPVPQPRRSARPESRVPKPARHVKEKNRRQKMKDLYRQLATVVSPENSLQKSPAFDVLDHATNYIKQLKNNINELKARKDSLQLPIVIGVNESERGESLEINIVCGLEKKKVLKMDKVFRILQEEGAEVVSATNSTVGPNIYHTILCKGFSPRIGMDTIRVQERLNNFISGI